MHFLIDRKNYYTTQVGILKMEQSKESILVAINIKNEYKNRKKSILVHVAVNIFFICPVFAMFFAVTLKKKIMQMKCIIYFD